MNNYVVFFIMKYSCGTLSMRIFLSTLIAKLIGASACHMVASLVFLNPILALSTLLEVIRSYKINGKIFKMISLLLAR